MERATTTSINCLFNCVKYSLQSEITRENSWTKIVEMTRPNFGMILETVSISRVKVYFDVTNYKALTANWNKCVTNLRVVKFIETYFVSLILFKLTLTKQT